MAVDKHVESDILVITALKLEHDAARDAFTLNDRGAGVLDWQEADPDGPNPYLAGTCQSPSGEQVRIALARPTRMAGNSLGGHAKPAIEGHFKTGQR